MRKIATALVALAFLATLLVLAPPARADHIFEAAVVDPPIGILPAPAGNRIGLAGPCSRGITDINFPENTGFFVAHGWVYIPWNDSSPEQKRAFVSQATAFQLSIDGVLQTHVEHTALVNMPDGQYLFKYEVIENDAGMTGTHAFLGQWFYDASDPSIGGQFGTPVLMFECALTIHFAP